MAPIVLIRHAKSKTVDKIYGHCALASHPIGSPFGSCGLNYIFQMPSLLIHLVLFQFANALRTHTFVRSYAPMNMSAHCIIQWNPVVVHHLALSYRVKNTRPRVDANAERLLNESLLVPRVSIDTTRVHRQPTEKMHSALCHLSSILMFFCTVFQKRVGTRPYFNPTDFCNTAMFSIGQSRDELKICTTFPIAIQILTWVFYQTETALSTLFSANHIAGTAVVSVLPNGKRFYQYDAVILPPSIQTSYP